jgi:hypothetical protein
MSESEGDDNSLIMWEAAADPTTGAPMIKMTWDHKTKAYPLDRALATARDLVAAAAAAESDKALWDTLTDTLGLDEQNTFNVVADVRRRRTALQERTTARPFLRIGAALGYNTRRPMVAFHSGSLSDQGPPEQARDMAAAIYETAVAAAIDARTRHVLAERGLDIVAIEDILTEVCELGRGNGILPRG